MRERGPPTSVISFDPMLEELVASLVVSRPRRAPTPECLPTTTAPREFEAPVADTGSLTTAAQWTTDLYLMSPVQGPPQLTPPRAGAPGVADGCTTPATRRPHHAKLSARLARFTEEVQLKRMSPLIVSPLRQKVATTRQPLPKRSRRIAAQPLAHIPISKRGEVLLMQRMGFAPPQVQSHPRPSEHTTTFSQRT